MSSSSFKIFVTKKADADETAIYEYISETFGAVYADKFRKRLIELFTLISIQPFIGRPANGSASIRVLMMSKHNKIVYKFTGTEIVILRILNTRTRLSGKF